LDRHRSDPLLDEGLVFLDIKLARAPACVGQAEQIEEADNAQGTERQQQHRRMVDG
jgi:hypothetical protein